MTDPLTPESIAAMRTRFFERIATSNLKLNAATADIAKAVDAQNHNAVLGILAEMEGRMRVIQNIAIVLREGLED